MPRGKSSRMQPEQRLPRCRESRYIHSEMRARLILLLLGAIALGATPLIAQEHPVRRVANIVSVAVEEYGKGVDARGVLTSEIEFHEASDFLADAKTQAARLPGDLL